MYDGLGLCAPSDFADLHSLMSDFGCDEEFIQTTLMSFPTTDVAVCWQQLCDMLFQRSSEQPPSLPARVRTTSEVAESRSEQGKMVNQYTYIRKLGQGAFGKVKLASAPNGDRFAIKIIKKSMLKRKRMGKANQMEQLEREIAIMKKLDHVNCVKLFEILDDPSNNNLYLVIEYVERGAVMDGKPKGATPLPIHLARQYFRDLILGLDYLHFQGIIHRDIKPENLLLTAEGRVKLADFGVSHICDDDGEAVLSNSSGTPMFLAPEALESASFNGKLLDIWACGVTLFYFVFGQCPFLGDSIGDIYNSILTQELVFPSEVEASLGDLLTRLLDKNPETRISIPDILQHAWMAVDAPTVAAAPVAKIEVSDAEVRSAITNVDKLVLMIKMKQRLQHSMTMRRGSNASLQSDSSDFSTNTS